MSRHPEPRKSLTVPTPRSQFRKFAMSTIG